MTSDKPKRVHCPGCGTPIVLLPLRLYAGGDLEPADVPDVLPHAGGAVFAIVDDERRYMCPECGQLQRLEP